MSSILEELKRKRAEEGKSYLEISTKNDYSSVEKADKERQEQLKALEEAVTKLRTPYIDYKENPSTIQSISLEDESFSRPAGDTIQSNQGGVANVSLIDAGKAAAKGAETVAKKVAPVVKNEIKTTKDIIVSDVAQIRAGLKTLTDENQALALAKLDANKLLKYAKGEKGILNTLEFNRLKNSNKTKTIPAVAVMADEISRGTYKGTAEDIKKILKQGDDQAYTIWYNRNVAPFVNKAQQSATANTSMYGETAGNVMNTAANIGAKGLEFFGLSNVAGPVAAGGALGFSEGSSKIMPKLQSGYTLEEASRDIAVDTAKGAAFVALFQAASPILNKGISPSVTGVQRAAQSMVNGFLTTTGISLGTQALDLLKKDPDFDFIDWNEFEAGAKSGKYKDLQDYMNSDAFAKHVAGNRAAQVLISATVASLFNTYNVMKNMSINENRLVTAQEAAKFNPKRATYLKTLGLNEGATDEEIQAAFRRLSRELYVGGTVAPENLERWYAIVEAKNGLLPKEVLNTMVRTNTQPQQQTTSSVVPVNNTPTNVARPTQQATVVPPPSAYMQPQQSMVSTPNSAIDFGNGENYSNEVSNQKLPDLQLTKDNKVAYSREAGQERKLPKGPRPVYYSEGGPLDKKTQKDLFLGVYNYMLERGIDRFSGGDIEDNIYDAYDKLSLLDAYSLAEAGYIDNKTAELINDYLEEYTDDAEQYQVILWRAITRAYKDTFETKDMKNINMNNPYTVKGTDVYGNAIAQKTARSKATVLTKENYYDVLRAVAPLLDEKEVTEETLRLMGNYDLGAFDDRMLDKIQRQAEKNVFDKFAQTDEGKRLIASYKDGELQPIKAEKKDFSGGYTTAEGTPITNGIAKWAKDSAMKTDGKPDSYYHGSPFLFEEFKDTYTHNGKSLGNGYYLSKNKDWVKRNYAYSKGDKVYELVLNVKKPFNEEAWLKDKENIIKEAPEIAETFFPDVSPETFAEDIEYGRYFKDEEPTAYDTVKTITEYAQKNGVDTRKIWDWLGYDGIDIDGEVVIFKSNQAKYLDNPYPTSRPAFVAEPEVNFSTDWNNVSKKDFKDYVTQKLSDFSNSIDKIYLSKENKLGQWGVYVKGKEKTRIRGNMPFEDNYETYIPFEKGVSPDDMLETVKAELEQWYPKNENSTQGSFSMPENLPKKVLGNQRKFLKDFKQVGYVDVNGNKIESIEDFVDLCQIFRDPLAETSRFIFLDDNNVVVGQTALTSNSVNHVHWADDMFDFTYNLTKTAENFGATKFYSMHNHPSGNVEPSAADKDSEKSLQQHLDKLAPQLQNMGAIIIDHNEYSSLTWGRNAHGKRTLTTTGHIKMKHQTTNEIEQQFSQDGWTKMKINNRDTVATLASMVSNKPDFSSLMILNQHNYPMLLQELPNNFFVDNSSNFLRDYVKDLAKKNGGSVACIGTQDINTLEAIEQKGLVLWDAVCYKSLKDGSIDIVASSRSRRKLSRQYHLFKRAQKNEKVLPQPDSPKFNLEQARKDLLEAQKPKETPPKRLEKKPATKTKPTNPKRLEKKPEPDKRLGFDAVDKEKQALEEANNKLRDELAKQKEDYENRLKKKDEALEKFKQTKKEQKEKQKLKLKKKEEKKKEEQRFKSATPKGKLRMLGRKIEKQTGYYEISNYPELDKKYEEEFGKTIRQTIQTLKTRDIYPYLPAKFQDIVNTFADETYLKANWKTFDKYVKEALQIKELKDLVEKSDTPVAKRLLSIMQEHKSAPITIKNAKEMYDDLQILADIVELAQERLDYRRQPENWENILDKSAEALEELEKANMPKSFATKSAKRERKFDNFKKLPETFQTLKTRIQAAFGGNPNSPLKIVWDWFEEGREREAMLDSKFAENFDGLVEKAVGGWKFAGELEKDFAEDAPYIDAGITGTNPKTGKPYEENAKLPRDIIMHIVASSKNDDNLMSFCKILLGTDYKGNPVYSNPGGYIVPNEYYMKRGKIGEAYEKGKKYVFTKKDIEHLEGMLTETEKKFVEAALRVGDITAQYGNEVSQKLIGRDLFSVKNYIRIIRDLSTFDGELIDPTQLDNLANATSDKYVGIGGILGRGGSLEGRNHRSTRPIYGESLKQSVENSFGGAKKYIAYALPLYDTDYILEGRLPDKFEQVEVVDKEPKSTPSLKYVKVDEPPRNGADRTMYYVDNGDSYTVYKVAEKGKTMKQLLTNAGEEGFYDYYKQFVDGLVGRNKKYSKFASTRARVVLNANLRVAATQFFSYFQMGQFLNHPTSSMTRALSDQKTIFKLAKEFLESKDVDTSKLKGQRLVNRFIEYVTYTNTQRGLGKFSDDVRYVEAGSTVLGRINAGKLLATVDKFTVDATFRALMYDIMADGTKFGSEEFFKQFKSRLYSIYQSNPQYSAIYRTPLQNKGTAISTALSQFQTVMLQGFNNASQAAMAHEYYKRQGNEKEKKKWGKIFKRTVSGLIISTLTLIALKDYLDQLAGKEKDEPYVKRITMSFIQNMLSYTIVGDEIFSALFKFNDYDLTTNELSYFNTALDTFGEMGTLVTKPTPPNAIKLIKSLGQTIGLPTGSIENTFGILSNLTSGNAFKAYSVMKDKNKYEKWLKNQDAIGKDFKTFYEISQAVKEKTLAEKYGYVKGSETDTYGSLSYAKGRAIMDVLGIEQGKKMTKEQKKEYSKWYNIFKN